LIDCEAKELLEGIEDDGRAVLKIELIKSNGKGGNYIHLVQPAVNGLFISQLISMFHDVCKYTDGLKDYQCFKTDARTVQLV